VSYFTSGRRKICQPYPAKMGMKMHRIGWIGLAVLVALGLFWSAAATSKLVPMPSAEISSGLGAVR
jgi:hypothetical protein